MSDYGIHVRKKHNAILENLSRAVEHATVQGDMHDAGQPGGDSSLANALRGVCSACHGCLADPVMAEHLPENQSTDRKLGGFYAMSGLVPLAVRDRDPRKRSKREIQELSRAAFGPSRSVDVETASPLMRTMTADLTDDAPLPETNRGAAVLNRAMGVAL
jgi:hypothetical protein